jgi:hypothetical protein
LRFYSQRVIDVENAWIVITAIDASVRASIQRFARESASLAFSSAARHQAVTGIGA